jgi:hypothetical protein
VAFLGTKGIRRRLLLLATAGALLDAAAQSPAFDEYEVKAAYLYNFAKFVGWPSAAFQGDGDPISICVLGRSPLGQSLQSAVQGKSLGNKGFVVREIAGPHLANGCHILFVSDSERDRLRFILREVGELHLLTVGESESFTQYGGVINFKLKDSRIRFEIDAESASRAGLRVSSKLLSLAENARR